MIKCPYCGKSHYEEGVTFSTAMYFPPIWKDGVNINPDGNIHTTECKCLECGKKFLIENGESIECEQPEEPKVFTEEVSLNADSTYTSTACLSLKDFKPETVISLKDDIPIFFVYNDKKYKVDIQKVLKLLTVSEDFE